MGICGYMKHSAGSWHSHIQGYLHSKHCRRLSVMVDNHTSQEVASHNVPGTRSCNYAHATSSVYVDRRTTATCRYVIGVASLYLDCVLSNLTSALFSA